MKDSLVLRPDADVQAAAQADDDPAQVAVAAGGDGGRALCGALRRARTRPRRLRD